MSLSLKIRNARLIPLGLWSAPHRKRDAKPPFTKLFVPFHDEICHEAWFFQVLETRPYKIVLKFVQCLFDVLAVDEVPYSNGLKLNRTGAGERDDRLRAWEGSGQFLK